MVAPSTSLLTSGATRLSGSVPLRYMSPFFDQASTWYPRTIRELLQYCRVYYTTHPLISATISKLARYPITDVVVSHKSKAVVDDWKHFFSTILRIRTFLIEAHLDLLAQGNCFVSIIFPFIRWLVCDKCGNQVTARSRVDSWDYLGGRFHLECPKCGHKGPAQVKDAPLRAQDGIRLHRWDAMDVVIDDGDFPGTTRYLYRIPRILRNAIQMGKKHVVATVPMDFLEAVEQNKMVVMDPVNFRHIKREVLSGKHKGWGLPLIAPTLKYAFYLQIMMKAQEVILTELIVPLRVVFPQASSGSADPYNNVWMTTWKSKVEEEISRWRNDPLYIPVVPLPLGYQSIGGEGRSLLLSGEIRLIIEQIIASMEVPLEFVFSGTSYSASMVSLRQLENQCLSMIEEDRALVRWVADRVSSYLRKPKPDDVAFKPFKTADDLARRQYFLALADRGKISSRTLCAINDLDYEGEVELLKGEAKIESEIQNLRTGLQATAQGEALVVQAKYQTRAQAAQEQEYKSLKQGPMMGMTPPGGVGGPQATEQPMPDVALSGTESSISDNRFEFSADGQALSMKTPGGDTKVGVLEIARSLAGQLKAYGEQDRQIYMQRLREQTPQLHGLVSQLLSPPDSMRPPTEQHPSRATVPVL